MNLLDSLRFILLEDLASQIQQLKDKYVGEGKPMTEEDSLKSKRCQTVNSTTLLGSRKELEQE